LTKTVQLPVLPLTDVVVLPGMVVPVRLADAEIRAAIDAARAATSADPGAAAQVLLVPRLEGKKYKKKWQENGKKTKKIVSSKKCKLYSVED